MPRSSPIVVLDSGLGGLTVVRALRAAMPGENILYFGDTARLPYGSKTEVTVSAFVQQIIAYLRPYAPKHIVIGCNTATALALDAARVAFPDLSISGVIEPGANAAIAAVGRKIVAKVGVIATEATIRSKAYDQAIHRRREHVQLFLRATPLLAPIIEEGRLESDPLVQLALAQYLQPLIEHEIDVLLLGCTHYPVYRELIEKLAGSSIAVIDSARQCAEDVARRLRSAGLASPVASPNLAGDDGYLRCFVTDDPARFQRLAPRFLGVEIAAPQWVAPEDLYELQPVNRARMSVPA
jgi:glutamate racemase